MKRIVRQVGDKIGSKEIVFISGGTVHWKCSKCSTTGTMSSRGWGMARTCCGNEFYRNRDRLLIVWTDIHARTTDPRHPAYRRYKDFCVTGWDDFSDFKAWALGSGYEHGLDIDRIDNNLGYSPDNCRFVSRSENNRNRRTNRLVSAFGEIKTLVEWAEDERCSVQAQSVAARIDRYGWSAEKAISQPAKNGSPTRLIKESK